MRSSMSSEMRTAFVLLGLVGALAAAGVGAGALDVTRTLTISAAKDDAAAAFTSLRMQALLKGRS